jgi:hypothetical protein
MYGTIHIVTAGMHEEVKIVGYFEDGGEADDFVEHWNTIAPLVMGLKWNEFDHLLRTEEINPVQEMTAVRKRAAKGDAS